MHRARGVAARGVSRYLARRAPACPAALVSSAAVVTPPPPGGGVTDPPSAAALPLPLCAADTPATTGQVPWPAHGVRYRGARRRVIACSSGVLSFVALRVVDHSWLWPS